MDCIKKHFPEKCFDGNIILSEFVLSDNIIQYLVHFLKWVWNPYYNKLFIDNFDNLEHQGCFRQRLIQYVCEFADPNMLIYLVNKGVELDCENQFKKRPIHSVVHGSTECLKLFIQKGVNLKTPDGHGLRPIDHLCLSRECSSSNF